MPTNELRNILSIGETVVVEFKRCGNGISADTYETVCSFLNRFGGDIYLGVEDNGEVIGLPPKAAPDMVKNFISTVNNPDIISPTVYLSPKIIEYGGKTLIHIHIHPSAEVHTCNLDRYDDRLIVETNLVESYDLLMDFAEKHLWDKFYLEDDVRVNLRSKISREMLVNTLMHREFTSSFIAKFIIGRDQMFIENANRADKDGPITPDNLQPNPKNPIIAAFFRNIGYADELGSGVRNLYKYSRRYSGKDPELIDGDVFRIIVPLDDEYSFDAETVKGQSKGKSVGINDGINIGINDGINESQKQILESMSINPTVTSVEIAENIGISRRNVEANISKLKKLGLLEREGAKRNGRWIVKQDD